MQEHKGGAIDCTGRYLDVFEPSPAHLDERWSGPSQLACGASAAPRSEFRE